MEENNKLLNYFNGDELAASTWKNKYAAPGEGTPRDSQLRLAKEFARIEEKFNWEMNQDDKLKLSSYGYSRQPLTLERIYELFKDYKYVIPGGSVMSGLGTDELVSYSNCLRGDTKVLTKDDGFVPIKDLSDSEVEILTGDGEWVLSPFKCYGKQRLTKLTLKKCETEKEIYCTRDHNWFIQEESGVIKTATSDLVVGDELVEVYVDPQPLETVRWSITRIEETDIVEDVYCAEVPRDTHSFVIEGNILTGNCFVCKSPGDSYAEIMKIRAEQTQLMKRRGGVGYDLSELRPRGSVVKNAAKTSTGAASFMDVCSDITNEVSQCGRRGALMLSLNINHPDVEEFITKKQDLTKVTGANISVKVTDDFMKAVEAGEDYLLRYPVTYDTSGLNLEDYKPGELVEISDPGYKRVYVKKVNAKALWDILMHCAWNTAEPGIMFEGRMHNYSPDGVYPEFKMISTNPCLTGDTVIAVADERGGVTIKELAELGESFTVPCATKNESGVVIIKNRSAIAFKTGHKEVIKVVLSDGSSFRCTPDHRLALPDLEYIEAKDSLGLELSGANENPKVIGIEYLEEKEDVYDLTVDDYHNFFIVAKDENNLKSSLVLVHNCGEIPMGAYDSCRLIHLNLKSFIDNPFTENAKVNEELLYSVAYETMRLGDDLVELEIEAVNRIIEATKDEENKLEYELWSKINNTATKGRRAGAGFTSLSDAIAMLGLKYDSPEGLKMIDYMMKIVFTAQLDSEIDMAIERGTFPSYNANLEWKNGKSEPGNDWYTFISEKFPEKARRMREYGRRNISFSTVRKVAA